MYNILIVDDERIERNGIIMLLKRLSINAGIVEAANGKEAYEYLCSDEAEHIDILLTDVKMPFMDGITLIKKLNEDNIKLKTIIFSGYNEFEYAKLAVKLGVKDYILKPVDPVELRTQLRKCVQSLMRNVFIQVIIINRRILLSSSICIRFLIRLIPRGY